MRLLRIVCFAATGALLACSARGAPAPDPGLARRAMEGTAPDRPLRAIFAWRILDGDARFAGMGAARVAPPYHARLDLFGPRDEGYLSAALVYEELRLPDGPEAPVPPPAMIWAVLGVVSPPPDAVLRSTARDGDEVELGYAVGESRLRYVLRDGALRAVEWRGGGRRMAVELNGRAGGLPRSAAYRDWRRNTELHIEVESVEQVDPYPPEIWRPGR